MSIKVDWSPFCHVYSTLTMIRLNLTRCRKKRFTMSSSTLWIIVAVGAGEKMIFINNLKIWQRQTQSDMFIFGAIETLFLKFATHNWHLFVFSLSLCCFLLIYFQIDFFFWMQDIIIRVCYMQVLNWAFVVVDVVILPFRYDKYRLSPINILVNKLNSQTISIPVENFVN